MIFSNSKNQNSYIVNMIFKNCSLKKKIKYIRLFLQCFKTYTVLFVFKQMVSIVRIQYFL